MSGVHGLSLMAWRRVCLLLTAAEVPLTGHGCDAWLGNSDNLRRKPIHSFPDPRQFRGALTAQRVLYRPPSGRVFRFAAAASGSRELPKNPLLR